MSSTDVQLRFAAEFSLFLVSLAGLGYVFLRADLLTRQALARWVAGVGFLLLGGAAFLGGALYIEDPTDGLLVMLRVIGIGLVALASSSWRTDRGGQPLVRIGMVALVVAELAAATDRSSGIVDVARMIGAAGIGASLLAVSSRVISARIAATAAMLVLAVITVVAVSLSAVISNNIEDDAIRRYQARAEQEASAVEALREPALLPARVLAQALNTTTDVEFSVALARITAKVYDPSADPEQAEADRALVATPIRAFLALARDGVQRPTFIIRGNARVAVNSDSPTLAVALAGLEPVRFAETEIAEVSAVAVVDGQAYTITALPVSESGELGTLVVTTAIEPSFVELRRNALDDEEPGSGLQLATPNLVLLSAGLTADVPTVQRAKELAGAVINGTGDPVRITADDFVIAAPVVSAGATPMAVVLTIPRTQVEDARDDLYRNLFFIAMGAATAALVLSALAGERIGSGLRKILQAATAIEAGDLAVRTGVRSDDEIGTLAAGFDAMADSLQLKTTELEEAARRLEAVVAGMGEALVAVDADGRISAFNAAAEELCDVPAERARGQQVVDVVDLRSEDGESLADRLRRPVLEGWSTSGLVRQAGGRDVPVVVSAGTLRGLDGAVNGAVFVLRDTRREHELDRMKTEFLSTISHELRTPLTPIKGFSSILSSRELPRAQAKGFADEITAAADQLERVIGQLVNFATIVGGRLSLESEPVSLRSLVDERLAVWRERTGGSHDFVRRIATKLPRVVVDRTYLAQALDELLDNAVKYSPQGGRITVEARLADDTVAPTIELSVADHGVGIPADRIDTILEDFRQGDSSATRRFGGLGLGLTLVQRIARAHGGEVLVRSTGRAGTKVSVVLPVAGPDGGRS